ncbi:MAG: DNA polymerase III subunit delta [Planctomycetaceae bacterium]|nr:DNA polymerase III subunit delta [Planctomycetaceae bacterium]
MRKHATEFAGVIDAQGVPPVVVLVGGEEFLVRQSAAAIAGAIFGDDADEGLSRRNGDEVQWRDVHDELATVSMFASQRVVFVERADEFIKKNRPVLENYVAGPVRNSVLVLQPKSFPGNTRLAKAVAKSGAVVECTELEGAALARWLGATAKEQHGIELTRDAAALLIELVGSRLSQLESELAKLASCSSADRIDVEVVRSLVGGWQVQSTFDMLSALRRGHTGQALVEFGRLYESGEALPKLMGGVAYVYRRLARATEMARQGKGLNQALKDAGVFYKEIDESNRYMRRIGRDEAEQILGRLLAVDKGLKGADDAGRLPDHLLVERLLVQLAGAA